MTAEVVAKLPVREVVATRTVTCTVCRQPIKEGTTAVQYVCAPCSQQTGALVRLAAHPRCYEFLKEQETAHGAS